MQGDAHGGEDQMKERPILFSGPMVRAILDGRKTQTRRIVNLKGHAGQQVPLRFKYTIAGWWNVCEGEERSITIGGEKIDGGLIGSIKCPFGKTGDRLWVRESWWNANSYPYPLHSDGEPVSHWSNLVKYAADGNPENTPNRHYPDGLRGGKYSAPDPWAMWHKRPSIHMPRWASRINLEITGIRVERLQDILEEDAKEEGIKELGNCTPPDYSMTEKQYSNGSAVGFKTAKDAFKDLWESITGPSSWDLNPWVWVIEFKRSKS